MDRDIKPMFLIGVGYKLEKLSNLRYDQRWASYGGTPFSGHREALEGSQKWTKL
jgi:hypothetical protein